MEAMESIHKNMAEPIAIVGMGCRWPGNATTPTKMWEMLSSGTSAYSEFPSDRINIDAFYHPNSDRPGSLSTKGGYFLREDPRLFDPAFFGMNPLEATALDPAQRKLLEIVYEAFESAGATLESLSGSKTACYIGNFNYDHLFMQIRDSENPLPYAATSGVAPFLANRVSYVFNLTGPSMTVDTACSASLHALHLACMSLQTGECTAALAGAANLILTPDMQIFLDKLGALSQTSQCHTFDESADGYGRADGFGVFYLKRLADAERDGDPIRGIIRATAVNANGKTGGITHPSPRAQEEAMREAYRKAGLHPDDTGYYECHGTGTPVGDPLELSAILKVFSSGRTTTNPLLIGSVKTNIGHSEPSSGIAGMMKALLALENGIIPPTIGVKRTNSKIDFGNGRLKIVQHATLWPSHLARRASVASSGFGGANAHVIIEGVKDPLKTAQTEGKDAIKRSDTKFILPFSAHTKSSLASNIEALKAVAAPYSINDLSYTLGVRRTRFLHRAFAVASEKDLESSLAEDTVAYASKASSEPLQIAFVFTGQGAQWATMGKELLLRFPVFRNTLHILDGVLQRLEDPPEWTLEEILAAPAEESRINESEISQPICTALQIGLVELLRTWGVVPCAAVGHSSGEIAAAYTAGYLTGEAAIISAYTRGQAVKHSTRTGAMLAVGLGANEVAPYISELASEIRIACCNSPQSVTLSGETATVEQIREKLSADGIFARSLKTGGKAYHSHQMTEIGEIYESMTFSSLKAVAQEEHVLRCPRRRFFSSVLAEEFNAPEADASYWRQNLENPVLFAQALELIVRDEDLKVNQLVEIGPHSALAGPIRQLEAMLKHEIKFPAYASALTRGQSSEDTVLQLAGTLFNHNADINFEAINNVDGRRDNVIPDLPSYRFTYGPILYSENRLNREYRLRKHPRHDLLGSRLLGCSPLAPTYRNILRLKDLPWLRDCKVSGSVVLSPGCFIAMALEGARQLHEESPTSETVVGYKFPSVVFENGLMVSDSNNAEIMCNFHAEDNAGTSFNFGICSVADGSTTVHAQGNVRVETRPYSSDSGLEDDKAKSFPVPVDIESWYRRFSDLGLEYGPAFQALSELQTNPLRNGACAKLSLDSVSCRGNHGSSYVIHPTTLDACIQLGLVAAVAGRPQNIRRLYKPSAMAEVYIKAHGTMEAPEASVQSTGRRSDSGSLEAEIQVLGPADDALLEIGNVTAVPATTRSRPRISSPFSHAVWKPDFEVLRLLRARELYPPPTFGSPATFQKIDQAAITMLVQYVSKYASSVDTTKLDVALQRFFGYIMRTVGLAKEGKVPYGAEALAMSPASRDELISTLCREIEPISIEAQLMRRMYDNLDKIFHGITTGHEVTLKDDLLPKLYTNSLTADGSYIQLRRIVDLIGHKNPSFKYVEIGGGSAGATREILDVLDGRSAVRRYGSYCFTDVTSYFLSRAQTEFRECGGVSYATLDIEKDPAEQGFELGSYDVVVAANVLHATTTMDVTMRNVRSLLKPGGKLILVETTIETIWLSIVLGGFADYWKGHDDGRPTSPFMPVPRWEKTLLSNGFSGIEIDLDDYQAPSRTMNIMVSTALSSEDTQEAVKPAEAAKLSIIHIERPSELSHELMSQAQSQGLDVQLVKLFDAAAGLGTAVLLIEEESSLLNLKEEEFRKLRGLTELSDSAILVTRGGFMSAMVVGISKSWAGFAFSVVELDKPSSEQSQQAKLILGDAIRRLSTKDWEPTLATENGVTHIQRVTPCESLNALITDVDALENEEFNCDPTKSYLLIDCLETKLGQQLSYWLAEKGAKTIQFVESSKRPSQDERFFDQLRSLEVTPSIISHGLDVLSPCGQPIGGIVQGPASGVDLEGYQSLQKCAREQMEVAKCLQNTLHASNSQPDFIALLGSLSGIIAGSSLTAMAIDAFRESCARRMRKAGLNASYVALDASTAIEEVIPLIECVARRPESSVYLGLDPARLRSLDEADEILHEIQHSKCFSAIAQAIQAGDDHGDQTVVAKTSLKDRLAGISKENSQYLEVVIGGIVEKLSDLLFVPAEQINPRKPLAAYGLDSMIAAELRNWFAETLLSDVPVLELLSQTTPLEELASKAVRG